MTEQTSQKGAKTDKKSKKGQEGMAGWPDHRGRKLAQYGRATSAWDSRAAPLPARLPDFFYLMLLWRFCWGSPQLSFGDFLGVLSLGLANKKPFRGIRLD